MHKRQPTSDMDLQIGRHTIQAFVPLWWVLYIGGAVLFSLAGFGILVLMCAWAGVN